MERASAVDMEAIEDQKENIQPIRSGRSAAQLVSLFNPASSATSAGYNPITLIQARKQSHQRFQHLIHILQLALDNTPIPDPQDRALAQDLLKDPLDIYLK